MHDFPIRIQLSEIQISKNWIILSNYRRKNILFTLFIENSQLPFLIISPKSYLYFIQVFIHFTLHF